MRTQVVMDTGVKSSLISLSFVQNLHMERFISTSDKILLAANGTSLIVKGKIRLPIAFMQSLVEPCVNEEDLPLVDYAQSYNPSYAREKEWRKLKEDPQSECAAGFYYADFIVVDNLGMNALIGVETMRLMQCVINFEKHLININRLKVLWVVGA